MGFPNSSYGERLFLVNVNFLILMQSSWKDREILYYPYTDTYVYCSLTALSTGIKHLPHDLKVA